MAKESAGLLIWRRRGEAVEVLLVHPGGPVWAKRDAGAWSIPKGEIDPGEDALACARREVAEETGLEIDAPAMALTPRRQRSGKWVRAFAVEADCDPAAIRSNGFAMEWPPRSGRIREFPEVDRAAWFPLAEARARINPGQAPILDELAERLRGARQAATVRPQRTWGDKSC